jgi:hypothetical protein
MEKEILLEVSMIDGDNLQVRVNEEHVPTLVLVGILEQVKAGLLNNANIIQIQEGKKYDA